MDAQNIKDLINVTGALAEISGLFYSQVIQFVKSEEIALNLTKMYLDFMINRSNGGK